MAKISAAQVKELRERTGAGMLDCKKTLEESGGDIEAAVDLLRKKGILKAAKRAGRIASEGAVAALLDDDDGLGVLVEVNCETDFVARNLDFKAYVDNLLRHIARFDPKVLKAEEGQGALLDQKWIGDETETVQEATVELIAKIGEKITPRRFVRWGLTGEGRLHAYIHMGGKLGVLVEVGASADAAGSEPVRLFAKQVAMHIAASNPLTLNRDSVPDEVLNRERDIYRTQVIGEGKPEHLIDRIVEGKLNKFFKENCLLDQEWVHDTDLKVAKAMTAASKEAGADVTVRRFVRWQLGEGLKKPSSDPA